VISLAYFYFFDLKLNPKTALTLVDLSHSEKLTVNECKSLGFNNQELMCSSCNDLEQFKLAELLKNCNKCCLDDTNDDKKVIKSVSKYVCINQ
jgi:hypothetical protein